MLIEPVTVSRPVWAFNPIGVILPRLHALHPDVPDIAGLVMVRIKLDGCHGEVVARARKQKEKHLHGIPAEQGKLCPTVPQMHTQRQWGAGVNYPRPTHVMRSLSKRRILLDGVNDSPLYGLIYVMQILCLQGMLFQGV